VPAYMQLDAHSGIFPIGWNFGEFWGEYYEEISGGGNF